jgi:hypothetical protein
MAFHRLERNFSKVAITTFGKLITGSDKTFQKVKSKWLSTGKRETFQKLGAEHVAIFFLPKK